ncbi:hypothetical protein M8C21_006597 [Ambrosia artemisiifolia]|uniref:Serine carboxypeptidase-like 51 n=1 Tax=Ambrosia artemisiifolia TaxID=4212 RepID=A0AAD5C5D1_AMBAR|nr:hypothetical protein M8C21_006597 [Ambrosia artemisiifolia]
MKFVIRGFYRKRGATLKFVLVGAHMFWWLYKSPNGVDDPSKPWPTILWLQGGPGGSGVGFGNFGEIGPLDVNLKPRNSTWLQKANLLFVLSWGPLLKDVSRIDDVGLNKSNSLALKIQQQIADGQYEAATSSWSELEGVILVNSNNVNFYNFMLDDGDSPAIENKKASRQLRKKSYATISKTDDDPDLGTVMNGPIREKLKIIPANVTWGGQSDAVFSAMEGDFMKPRIAEIDELLSKGVNVTVYNGQVDLICATKGAEAWIKKLKWDGLVTYLSLSRTPLYCGEDQSTTKGFFRSYNNFAFYWILGAGHFVPVEQPCVSLQMVGSIVNSPNGNL